MRRIFAQLEALSLRAGTPVFGYPIAAPETPMIRRLRHRFAALCVMLAGLTLFAGPLLSGTRYLFAVVWITNASQAAATGYAWLRAKARADAAWLDQLASGKEEDVPCCDR